MAGRRVIERGDIWQYRFAPPDKRRPVLVLSRQVALNHLHTALIAPITTTIRGLPSEVRLTVDDGLKQECVANLDHILSVRQGDLRKYLGHLDDVRMRELCRAAAIALGCI
jgi:mRNA interferase MazF